MKVTKKPVNSVNSWPAGREDSEEKAVRAEEERVVGWRGGRGDGCGVEKRQDVTLAQPPAPVRRI